MAAAVVAAVAFAVIAHIASHQAASLSAPDLVIYLSAGASDHDVATLRTNIARTTGAHIERVSPEDALARLERDLGGDTLLDAGGIALVPASLEITLPADSAVTATAVAHHLEDSPAVDDIAVVGGWSRRARRILASAHHAALIAALAAALAALLIAFFAIRRRARAARHEIAVWSLLGAPEGFVRAPFVVEGALFGVLAAAIAVTVAGIAFALWPAATWLGQRPDASAVLGLWIAAIAGGGIAALWATPRRITGWLS